MTHAVLTSADLKKMQARGIGEEALKRGYHVLPGTLAYMYAQFLEAQGKELHAELMKAQAAQPEPAKAIAGATDDIMTSNEPAQEHEAVRAARLDAEREQRRVSPRPTVASSERADLGDRVTSSGSDEAEDEEAPIQIVFQKVIDIKTGAEIDEPQYKVFIDETEAGGFKKTVWLMVNNVGVEVPRGRWVILPRSFVECLKRTIGETFRQSIEPMPDGSFKNKLTTMKVPRFSFSADRLES